MPTIYGGGLGFSFLEGREVSFDSSWAPLSQQLRALRKYNHGLDRHELIRLPLNSFGGIRKGDIEQAEQECTGHVGLALELFSQSATALASWRPLIDSAISADPGGVLDILPLIRDWGMGREPIPAISVVEYTFYDLGGMTMDEVIERADYDPHQLMAGHEIALTIYLQGFDLWQHMRDNKYRIIAGGVVLAQPQTMYPYITWVGESELASGLGVFAQRFDTPLRAGSLLPVVTDRTTLVRI